MNKKLTRFFCLVLCTVLVCGLLPATASAAENTFETFEELKELAAGTYTSWTYAYYTGEGPLVISEDLKLPLDLCLSFHNWSSGEYQVIVNEGVTFELTNYCTGGDWTVNGTLIVRNEMGNVGLLTVNGSLLNYGTVRVGLEDVTGLENISNEKNGYIWWNGSFTDGAGMLALLAEAEAHPESEYEIYADYGADPFEALVTEDLTVPFNVWLHGEENFTLTIAEGAALRMEGRLSLSGATLNVHGTLNNRGDLNLSWLYSGADECYYYGSMAVSETGTYTGPGGITISAGDRTDYKEAVSGLDLSQFTVETTEYEGAVDSWYLTLSEEYQPIEPDEPEEPVVSDLPFVDLVENAFYLEPVVWANELNITNGYGSSDTFCPEVDCTRGQIVTFLWRAQGCPEPTSTENPFTDVKETDYFYKPVLWALENKITTGLNDTEFGPDVICTRGQVATFLWRSAGEPAPTSSENPFQDVAEKDYFYNAVLWAVEQGVTNGYGNDYTFNPSGNCNRGQIVTFLFRALA